LRVGMVKVIFVRHILAQPFGSIDQILVKRQGCNPISLPILIDAIEEV
jgi:hypothetical protein